MTSTEIKESLKKLVTSYEVLQQIDQLFLEVATLRAENARLQSKCDEQGRGIMDAAARLKVLTDDLQRHHTALKKARVALKWFGGKSVVGPDYHDSMRQIDEVLK